MRDNIDIKPYGLVQTKSFRHPDRHEEEVEDVVFSNPWEQKDVRGGGSQIIPIILIGDQNAGKTTLQNLFVDIPSSSTFIRLLSFIPILASSVFNVRFLTRRKGESKQSFIARGRDEGPYLDSDLCRGAIMMASDDFAFFRSEFQINSKIAQQCAGVVTLEFTEFGGDHLDRLLSFDKNNTKKSPNEDLVARKSSEEDLLPEYVTENSLKVLKDICGKGLIFYVLNLSTYFSSEKGNFLTTPFLKLYERLGFLKKQYEKLGKLKIAFLCSRLPSVWKEPAVEFVEEELSKMLGKKPAVNLSKDPSDFLKDEAQKDVARDAVILDVIREAAGDDIVNQIKTAWLEESNHGAVKAIRKLLYQIMCPSLGIDVALVSSLPLVPTDLSKTLKASSAMEMVNAAWAARALKTLLDIAPLPQSQVIGMQENTLMVGSMPNGLEKQDTMPSADLLSTALGFLILAAEHNRYSTKTAIAIREIEPELSIVCWTDRDLLVSYVDELISLPTIGTHDSDDSPDEEFEEQTKLIQNSELAKMSLARMTLPPQVISSANIFRTLCQTLAKRGAGLCGYAKSRISNISGLGPDGGKAVTQWINDQQYISNALLDAKLTLKIINYNTKLAEEYSVVCKANFKMADDAAGPDAIRWPVNVFLFEAIRGELIRVLGSSWKVPERFWTKKSEGTSSTMSFRSRSRSSSLAQVGQHPACSGCPTSSNGNAAKIGGDLDPWLAEWKKYLVKSSEIPELVAACLENGFKDKGQQLISAFLETAQDLYQLECFGNTFGGLLRALPAPRLFESNSNDQIKSAPMWNASIKKVEWDLDDVRKNFTVDVNATLK